MMKKTLQVLNKNYLHSLSNASPSQIAQWLEDYRKLLSNAVNTTAKDGTKNYAKSKLISIKIPEDLLNCFRQKAQMHSIPYQTLIKKLMREWLTKQ